MNGGEMIDSGGFGCVFRPPLRCANKTRKHDGISKLQIKKNALNEYNTIKSIQKVLKKVPNYKDYYIIDATKCVPDKLTAMDQQNMTCTTLERRNITQKNINKHLKKLMLIQMEYGGISLKKIARSIETYSQLVKFYSDLLVFFERGILPMNNVGIIHSDIKLPNILFHKKLKLIDWGYTYNLNTKHEIIPKRFHYNICFGVVLFDKQEIIHEYFKNYEVNRDNVKLFCEYIVEQFEHEGHYESLEEMLDYLDVHNLKYIVVEYLSEIVLKYTDEKTRIFDFRTYFYEVYVINCDIWSFLIMLLEVIDFLNPDLLQESSVKEFRNNIINIVVKKYLFNFKYATQPYNPKSIIRDIYGIVG